MRRGVLRSAEERERLISGWRASGRSVPVFARQEGVPSSTLYQWVRPVNRQAAPRILRVVRKARAARPRDERLVIEVGSARIRVAAGFDRAVLACVLEVLEA